MAEKLFQKIKEKEQNKYKKINYREDVLQAKRNQSYHTTSTRNKDDVKAILRQKRRESDPKHVKYMSPSAQIQKKLDYFYMPYSRNQI